jgi:hypothetical protein
VHIRHLEELEPGLGEPGRREKEKGTKSMGLFRNENLRHSTAKRGMFTYSLILAFAFSLDCLARVSYFVLVDWLRSVGRREGRKGGKG